MSDVTASRCDLQSYSPFESCAMSLVHRFRSFRPRSLLRPTVSALAGAVLGAISLLATAAAPATDVDARYTQERARCLGGESGQAQATCLKEAGAARDAARQGQLNDGDAKYRKNAKQRCDALAGDERRDCIARIKGAPDTSVSGSVKGGGTLSETVTRETKPVAPAAQVTPAEPAASAP